MRTLANPAGDAIVERLEAFNDKERSYSYSILKAPFPVTGYYSTLKVKPAGGSAAVVEWSGSFTPAGASEQEATQLFFGIYTDGLAALKEKMLREDANVTLNSSATQALSSRPRSSLL